MNAMAYWYEQIDWAQTLEVVSGGVAGLCLLWETSIWLSILFIH